MVCIYIYTTSPMVGSYLHGLFHYLCPLSEKYWKIRCCTGCNYVTTSSFYLPFQATYFLMDVVACMQHLSALVKFWWCKWDQQICQPLVSQFNSWRNSRSVKMMAYLFACILTSCNYDPMIWGVWCAMRLWAKQFKGFSQKNKPGFMSMFAFEWWSMSKVRSAFRVSLHDPYVPLSATKKFLLP